MVRWLAERINRYRGLGAVRRAARAAIVMPAMFAVGDTLIGNPTVATFAAFGSFAMVLLVDFGGSMRSRLEAHISLAVAGVCLVCVGTLAGRNVWLAVPVAAVVAFTVLFSGVVSSVLASASTALLLSFVLPVSIPGSVSAIPDRVAGWGLAGAASVVAAMLLWPSPVQDPLRTASATACGALADRLRSDVAYRLAGCNPTMTADHDDAVRRANDAVEALRRTFNATPYRPTGLSTSERALVRLIDELTWLDLILRQSLPATGLTAPAATSIAVKEAAARALTAGADLLARSAGSPEALRQALRDLESALTTMEAHASAELPVGRLPAAGATSADDQRVDEVITSLEPSFRAQEVSFAVELVGGNIVRAVTAEQRDWWERLLGHQPEGLAGPVAAAWERAAAHLERHSVWLHNSLRGAAALAAAVLVAEQTGVQHSFWVVFGTLSVLRSNALNTGQNALRAVLGTAVGFAVGAALIEVIGTNETVLWVLLPIAVFLAGITPALISFAAGQAAFTVTIVVLYNLVAPAGWRVGLVRVEDVAIGCGVSIVVGLLFWPRGASASLRTALAEAYQDSARYLDEAVRYAALRCDSASSDAAGPTDDALQAAAASRRLDDTFRSYLAERGPKPESLAHATSLVTGVAALRLAGDAIVDIWQRDDQPSAGNREAARTALLANSGVVRQWYDDLATSLLGAGDVRAPLGHDTIADGRLIEAIRQDLRDEDGIATDAAVRVIWTADHLDAARRLQQTIAGPAQAATTG
jgi:Fusaric acid resistance protein-like